MKHAFRTFTCAALLGLAACPMMDDDDEDDGAAETTDAPTTDPSSTATTDATTSDDDGSSTADAPGSVAGVVRRTAVLPAGEDGVGTLFLGAFAECDHAAPLVGIFVAPMADLSQDGGELPFVIEGLPPGTVYLAGFLDDDGNADPMAPLPDEGDPVLADDVEDGLLTCVAATIDGDDVVVELNEIEDAGP